MDSTRISILEPSFTRSMSAIATNVTPAEVRAGFNIRFRSAHSAALIAHIRKRPLPEKARGVAIALTAHASGEPFLTKPGAFTDLLARAAEKVAGKAPDMSTTGGTSDARFIKDHCPVAELGLSNGTMHKANECATLADIRLLTDIYAEVIGSYFAHPPQ